MRYSNQRLREYCGRPDTGPCPIEDLVHPDDGAAFRKLWTEAAVSGMTFETELRLLRAADLTWRRHLMRAVPFNSGEAASDNWFGTFTDIEDQKRAEEASRRREKLDSIGVLAGGVAHDFNNLLVGIMGGASFAMSHFESDHSLYPMLEIILRSSEKAAALTQQLLAYAGNVQLSSEPADISSIVRDGCDRVRRAMPPNVRLVVESDENIPLIETSPSQVGQIVANLVENAAEAIGEAPGWIRVRTAIPSPGSISSEPGEPGLHVLACELPPGECVSVEVSDSGVGMDRRMLSQIFDPFFTTKFTGRGLGLAVVQGVVRSMGGGIHVASSPGNGSTFTILLPLRRSVSEAEPPVKKMKANGTQA
jgi:signal transduction histidine kinase